MCERVKGVNDMAVVPRRRQRSEKEFDFQSWQKPSAVSSLKSWILPDESFDFFSCGYADPRRESFMAQQH